MIDMFENELYVGDIIALSSAKGHIEVVLITGKTSDDYWGEIPIVQRYKINDGSIRDRKTPYKYISIMSIKLNKNNIPESYWDTRNKFLTSIGIFKW